MKKKGLSQIVVIVLLILISMIAVIVLWNVIGNFIKNKTPNDTSQLTISISIDKSKVTLAENSASLKITRNLGEGQLSKLKFVFMNKTGSYSQNINSDLKEYDSNTFTFNLTGKINGSALASIEVYPIVTSADGKEIYGTKDVYTISGNEQSNTNENPIVNPNPPANWWDSAWLKRTPINITELSGTNLVNFQINFNIAYDSGMKSDYSDLRFVDSDKNKLNYWIEDYNSTGVKIWLNINMSSLTRRTIYMYYSNPSASSESNGNNVFDFFDDFNDRIVDSSKWVISYGTGSVTEDNGLLDVNGNANSWARIYSQNSTFTTPSIIERKVKFSPYDSSERYRFNPSCTPGTNPDFLIQGKDTSKSEIYWGGNSGIYIPANQFVLMKITEANSIFYLNLSDYASGNSIFFRSTSTYQLSSYRIDNNIEDGYGGGHFYMDWVFVHKYTLAPRIEIFQEESQ